MMEVTAPAFCHLSVSLGVLFIRLPFLLLHLSGSVSSSHVMNDGTPHETQPSWWSLRGLVPLIWTPTSSPFHPFIKQLCTNPEFLWNSQLLEMIKTQGGNSSFSFVLLITLFQWVLCPAPQFYNKNATNWTASYTYTCIQIFIYVWLKNASFKSSEVQRTHKKKALPDLITQRWF